MPHQMFFKGTFTFYNPSDGFQSLTNWVCMQATLGAGLWKSRPCKIFWKNNQSLSFKRCVSVVVLFSCKHCLKASTSNTVFYNSSIISLVLFITSLVRYTTVQGGNEALTGLYRVPHLELLVINADH